MKKILSLLGTITLIGTSTTSLIACNTPQEYTPEELEKLKEKNKINTANQEIKDNLKWIAPQEKPFITVDNKYYFVVWHGDKNNDWRIVKFKHFEQKEKVLDKYDTDGTNCSYIIDMFSIQALYKGNFEIIFYADNPYTNNEEDCLRLSVWSFRGKTKSTLNNYLRDMTTNYKTSFLLPHDYEIPTFNYPEYVLPPVPYNYKPYTQDIWNSNTGQALITKITAPVQCKVGNSEPVNLFSDEFNEGYYETEIDLKQIDPTIQSIEKFISSYKTIEISNLGNLQVRCVKPDIERFIKDRNVNLSAGDNGCDYNLGLLSNITLQKSGLEQKENVNFDNTITLYTKNIKVNDVQTFATASTNGLSGGNYPNTYFAYQNRVIIKFLLQITKLSDNINDKIKETYLQAYYTNDMKLKIRFVKVLFAKLLGQIITHWKYWGNDKNITIDINALGVLNMVNNSDNPIKITMKPR